MGTQAGSRVQGAPLACSASSFSAGALLFLAGVVVALLLQPPAPAGTHPSPACLQPTARRPHVLNATYHPSTYEKEWARLVAQPGGVMGLPVCLLLAEPQHKGRVERILRVLDAQHEEEAGRLPAGATDAALDELEKEVDEGQLLSRMEYTLSDGTAVSVRMEPLVGLLRDPRQFCPEGSRSPWMPQVPDMMHGDMREWLLLDGRRAQLHQGQRAVLMDMGASTWGHTGARWLNHRLQQHGMAYEHIWSFEAKSKPVMEFLNGAAPVDMARIHFYNVPVGGAVDPWAMLKSTAKPEDFVAVKLDIDTMAVEIPLAYQLLEDPELLALVDEFYFEYHYLHSELMWLFGVPSMTETLDRATLFFAALRSKGVRAYSWF